MTIDTHARPALDPTAAVAVAALHVMASSDRADYEPLFAPQAFNRESVDEPLDTRGTGPGAFFATSSWLRTAFSDLAWEVHDVVHDGELVVIHATMTGRQTGPFTVHAPDGSLMVSFPPSGRGFAATQSHWFRVEGGRVTEHWANRDDRGMGMQLGWAPPAAS